MFQGADDLHRQSRPIRQIGYNPSVTSGDSSPYTGEPLVWVVEAAPYAAPKPPSWGGGLGERAVEHNAPTFPPQCGSEKRMADNSIFRNRCSMLSLIVRVNDCFVYRQRRRSRAAALAFF